MAIGRKNNDQFRVTDDLFYLAKNIGKYFKIILSIIYLFTNQRVTCIHIIGYKIII